MDASKTVPNRQDGESVAIQAISFLANRPEELSRFLALSGTDPGELRQLVENAAFLGGILDFLLQDEALLLVFAEECNVSPANVEIARRNLEIGDLPLDSNQV